MYIHSVESDVQTSMFCFLEIRFENGFKKNATVLRLGDLPLKEKKWNIYFVSLTVNLN